MFCNVCGAYGHEATSGGCPLSNTFVTYGNSTLPVTTYKFTQTFRVDAYGRIELVGDPIMEVIPLGK